MNDVDLTEAERNELFSSLHYDKETGVFTWIKGAYGIAAGRVAGNLHRWGYMRISFKRHRFSAHRLAWYMTYGRWPIGQIDHIDGNKANNAIANLREVTPSLNQQLIIKPRSGNKTGLVGASLARGRFKATIRINGAVQYLGQFPTPEEAHAAYMNAKVQALSAQGIALPPTPSEQETPK